MAPNTFPSACALLPLNHLIMHMYFFSCKRLKALMTADYILTVISFYSKVRAHKLRRQLITASSKNYLAKWNYPFILLILIILQLRPVRTFHYAARPQPCMLLFIPLHCVCIRTREPAVLSRRTHS